MGLHPIPLRHGLTVGELARWLNAERHIGCDLDVVPMEGWRREMTWADTGLPYVMPSPNLPTPDSCAVYPGMVLVEGTNLSEGRGTTRPFELVGAPYLDGFALAERLEAAALEGVRFRPCNFEPTFQKHAGARCGGVQLHVTDAAAFRPVRAAVELFVAARALAPAAFAWRRPPYEYEERLMPIDILWGHDGLREGVDAGRSADEILAGVDAECTAFLDVGAAVPALRLRRVPRQRHQSDICWMSVEICSSSVSPGSTGRASVVQRGPASRSNSRRSGSENAQSSVKLASDLPVTMPSRLRAPSRTSTHTVASAKLWFWISMPISWRSSRLSRRGYPRCANHRRRRWRGRSGRSGRRRVGLPWVIPWMRSTATWCTSWGCAPRSCRPDPR